MSSPANGIPRRDGIARSARALLVPLLLIIAGCQSTGPQQTVEGQAGRKADPKRQSTVWISDATRTSQAHADIWERIRAGFKLQDHFNVNPRIEQQRLWFASNPAHMQRVSVRSAPYIHYVVERLEERNMPLELALLPVIESAYNPYAYSRSHAVGLWQFIPSTGRYYNLRQTNWYDGRRDVTASTNAALTYLLRLHDMFNGDWMLAVAAYNAGEGTVSRAIERNQKLGLPTDYWNLPLSKETQDYVPKLLALSQVVLTPEAYGVNLNPVANRPYFEQIAITQRLDLARVAQMGDLSADELYLLNPAFTRKVTMDGPSHLLVPAAKAELLSANLSQLGDVDLLDWREYKVRSGDNLQGIASRHDLTVSALKEANQLQNSTLRAGQVLSIPAGDFKPAAEQPKQVRISPPVATLQTTRSYRIKPGDTLWTIARNNKVSVSQLQQWNKLHNQPLKAGQVLTLQGSANPAVASTAKKVTERQSVTYYQVREGDSMYQISRRFKVDMARLQAWNPTHAKNLKPGQTLTLYLTN